MEPKPITQLEGGQADLPEPSTLPPQRVRPFAGSLPAGLAFGLLRSQQAADPAGGVRTYVKAPAAPGEVYLVPARLQEFRLATGAPIVVDFKAIPYRAVDVLQWSERLRLVDFVSGEEPHDVDCALLDEAAQRYGVTHVVLDEDPLDLDCPQLRIAYANDRFALGVLTPPR